MKKEKIIISCGGTGGHIFPGLEIANAIKKHTPNIDIIFVMRIAPFSVSSFSIK